MENVLTGLLLSLSTETADIKEYVWESEQVQISVEQVLSEEDRSLSLNFSIELLNGWKGYYNNEQNGPAALSIDVINSDSETVKYSFPDPKKLYFYDESFIGYNEDYIVSVKVRDTENFDALTSIEVNASFCKDICLPIEFTFFLE